MKFPTATFLVTYLFVFILLFIPVYDIVTQRDSHPALRANIDIVCMCSGILGSLLGSALLSLHRRIRALEKSIASVREQP